MKKQYVKPTAEKLEFNYEENVAASGCGYKPWWPWWPWFKGQKEE